MIIGDIDQEEGDTMTTVGTGEEVDVVDMAVDMVDIGDKLLFLEILEF